MDNTTEVTFEVEQEVVEQFDEVKEKLKQKYPDEPFDEDEFINSKMKEFNQKQMKLMGVMAYNEV